MTRRQILVATAVTILVVALVVLVPRGVNRSVNGDPVVTAWRSAGLVASRQSDHEVLGESMRLEAETRPVVAEWLEKELSRMNGERVAVRHETVVFVPGRKGELVAYGWLHESSSIGGSGFGEFSVRLASVESSWSAVGGHVDGVTPTLVAPDWVKGRLDAAREAVSLRLSP